MNPPLLASSSNAAGAYWPQRESVPKSQAAPVAGLVADVWPATAPNVYSSQTGILFRDAGGADIDIADLQGFLRTAAWIYLPTADRVYRLNRVWQATPKTICADIDEGVLPLAQADPAFTGVAFRTVPLAYRYSIRIDSTGPTIEGQAALAQAQAMESVHPFWQSRPTCYNATAGSVSISINI